MASIQRLRQGPLEITSAMVHPGDQPRRTQRIAHAVRACLLLPPIGILALATLRVLRESFYYVTGLCFASCAILLLNFPQIVQMVYARPVYYEDLEDNEAENVAGQRRYQILFVHFLILPASVFFAVTCDFLLYRVHDTDLSWFAVFGILSGAISGFQIFMEAMGGLLMWWLHVKKSRVVQERRLSADA